MGARPASAGSRSTTSSPSITRWRSGSQSPSVARRRPCARRHRVVEVEAHAHEAVGALAVEGGHDEGQRADEVRRQLDHELALEQRLAHEAEVEVLQVAQAAVDELARAAGGPRGVVGLLDERDRVAARGRVERDAGAGDPAADDDDVEALGAQGGEGVGAGDHAGHPGKGAVARARQRAPQAHRQGHDRHLRVDLRRGRHRAAVGHVEAADAVDLQLGVDHRARPGRRRRARCRAGGRPSP